MTMIIMLAVGIFLKKCFKNKQIDLAYFPLPVWSILIHVISVAVYNYKRCRRWQRNILPSPKNVFNTVTTDTQIKCIVKIVSPNTFLSSQISHNQTVEVFRNLLCKVCGTGDLELLA